MALDQGKLKDAILDITGAAPYPATVADAASEWSIALDDYFSDGTANLIPVITPGPAPMVAPLTSAFQAGSAAAAAAGVTAALDLFWLNASFPPPFVPPCVPGGSPGLTAALTGIFSVLSDDAGVKADEIATAIDIYSKLVIATFNIAGVPTPFNVV